MSDPHLLVLLTRRVAAGDEDAFRNLFGAVAPRVLGWMAERLDRSAAEAATQDVMLRVWLHADRYDEGRAPVATWIFAIARSVATARPHQTRHRVDASDPAWVPEPAANRHPNGPEIGAGYRATG